MCPVYSFVIALSTACFLALLVHHVASWLRVLVRSRIVDFGPGTDVNYAFTAQTVMNPLGKSPPMCSEF